MTRQRRADDNPALTVLDISEGELSRLDVTSRDRGLHLLRWDRQPVFSASGPACGPDVLREALLQAGRELADRMPPAVGETICCLPAGWLDIETIRLNDADEIDEDRVRQAAEECYELPGEQLDLVWLDAGPAGFGPIAGREITLLKTDADALADQQSLLEVMGIPSAGRATAVEAVAALAEQADAAGAPTCRCILHMGLSSSTMVVCRGRQVLLARSVPLGTWSLEHAAEDPTVDLVDPPPGDEQATPSRHDDCAASASSESDDSCEPGVLSLAEATRRGERSVLHRLAGEVALSLRYLEVMFAGLRPTSLSVTGAESCRQDAEVLLSEELDLPVEPLMPPGLQGPISEDSGQASAAGPSVVAIGAGLIGLLRQGGVPLPAAGRLRPSA